MRAPIQIVTNNRLDAAEIAWLLGQHYAPRQTLDLFHWVSFKMRLRLLGATYVASTLDHLDAGGRIDFIIQESHEQVCWN
jgi:hypothetical protein